MTTARLVRERLTDPLDLLKRLALGDAPGSITRQSGGGVLLRCLWHAERTPSCSIHIGADGTIAIRCHGCGKTGDVFSLIAAASGLDERVDFREVLRRGEQLAGLGERRDDKVTARNISRAPAFPPSTEVSSLLASVGPTASDAEATAVLSKRRLDPERIDDAGLAFVIPGHAVLPSWARYRGRPWTETGHRLVMPVVDPTGVVRSVRAWNLVENDAPKRLPPAGHRATGLVVSDEFGAALFRGTYRARRVVIVEGESDFLTAVLAWGHVLAAKIGIWSGSWTSDFANKMPDGAEVTIWTDDDAAGDRYAAEIWRSLRGRCRVTREKRPTEAA